MNNIQKDLLLLPNYFKKISYGLIVFSILLAVLSITKVLPFDKDLVKIFTLNCLLISLLLLALSKDRIEDELTLKIRLKAFAASFIFGVVVVIIEPYISFLFDGSFLSDKGAIELMVSMFFFYFFMFFMMKKKR